MRWRSQPSGPPSRYETSAGKSSHRRVPQSLCSVLVNAVHAGWNTWSKTPSLCLRGFYHRYPQEGLEPVGVGTFVQGPGAVTASLRRTAALVQVSRL